MSINVDFVLRASTASFTRGLAAAKNGMTDLKKAVRGMNLGGGIAQMFGLGGFIAGLKSAVSHAQEMRNQAYETGVAIDGATAALARFGDTMGKLGEVSNRAFGYLAQGMERVGLFLGGLVYGFDNAADAQKRFGEEAEAAARKAANDKLLQLEKLRTENAFKRVGGEEQINMLLREQVDLINAQAKLQAGSIAHTEKAVALEKNRAAIADAMKKVKQEEAEMTRRVNEELTVFFASVENGAKRIKATEEARVKAAQELANQAEREAEAKAKQLETESTLKKLNDAEYAKTVAAMSLSGLSPRDVQSASDATLQEIARRKAGNLQSLGAAGGSLAFDDNYFTRIQLQNEINQVKAELATRSNLRQSVAQQGIEGARRTSNLDPLVFDKLVQQFVQDSRSSQALQAKTLTVLERIDQRQRTGAPVIVMNS